ncbi:D-alanyl-D-alanine carboxypeptidase/D-alanyl-D-alanine-endopeptidase [Schlesneria sp. T3-172]|uniref:D-alanyl-D-alanine carboxypeptidase/D-alanyl-D-alanine endopeptidase n=1 Tax=Schlesneria sphaerica TaxID=3373610 RepID=UPI0037C95BEF
MSLIESLRDGKSGVIRNALLLGFVFCLAWGNPLGAQETLIQGLEKITQSPRFKHAHWGALFVDRETGQVVFEHNTDKLFIPASTTKLYSVATALKEFGAEYRFRTPVVRRGDVSPEGVLEGDLILVASGDLSFGGRTSPEGTLAFADGDHTYANGNPDAELTAPDPLAGIQELAEQIAKSGIRRVRGDVLIDDRLFEKAESSGSGPSQVTPVLINDNLIDFQFKPTQPGLPAELVVRPATSAFQVESKVLTVGSDQSPEIEIRDLGSGRFSITGQVPAGHTPVLRVHEVADAASLARTVLIEALLRKGIQADAPTLAEAQKDRLPRVDEVKTLPKVAELTSLPFSESIKLILKVSHNLHASTLPLLVAANHGETTLAAGLKRQHDFLKEAGVEVETISFAGGAGGTRSDYVTPRATVQLLRYMATRPDFPIYQAALPRLGVDGTLAKNIPPDSAVRDKVQAKTGTLYTGNTMNGTTLMTSKALAGYMTTAKGKNLIFAMFVNNAHLRDGVTAKTFGDDLGKFCEAIYLKE